ncbi:MAG: ABC transporter substrate-binding protein [Bacillota bacterium]
MTESKRAAWGRRLVGAALILGLLLTAGCAAGGAKPAADAAPETAPAKTVRIGYLNVMDDAPVMLAEDAQIYAKHGVKAELQQFTSGTDLIKAIVGGQLDAGVLGFTNAVTWASKGADLKVVGGAQMGYHSLLVRKDSGIKTVADLKGRRLASQQQGSTADIVLNGVVLSHAGLTRQDLNLTYTSPAVAITSLAAGQVDAAFVFEPYDHMARLTSPVESIYEIGKEWPFPCMVVIASGKALSADRDAINRMLDAQKEAIVMLEEKPEEAARVLAPRFIPEGSLTTESGEKVPAADVVRDAIKAQSFDWKVTPDQVSRMQEVVGLMVDQGALAQTVDVKGLLDLSWQEKASQ